MGDATVKQAYQQKNVIESEGTEPNTYMSQALSFKTNGTNSVTTFNATVTCLVVGKMRLWCLLNDDVNC